MGERHHAEARELHIANRLLDECACIPQPATKTLSEMTAAELHAELRRLEMTPWNRGAAEIDRRHLRGAQIRWYITKLEGRRDPGPFPTLGAL
jgi:hypothetical protein